MTAWVGCRGSSHGIWVIGTEHKGGHARNVDCIGRLKQRRGLAVHTDKLAIAYRAALHLAAILNGPTITKETGPSCRCQPTLAGSSARARVLARR